MWNGAALIWFGFATSSLPHIKTVAQRAPHPQAMQSDEAIRVAEFGSVHATTAGLRYASMAMMSTGSAPAILDP